MSKQNTIAVGTAASILLVAALSISAPAQSSETGAFLGGVVATKVLGNMKRRTEAEEAQAYNSSRPVQQAAPAPAASSTEQKLDQLNKLAAGGYITPEEYKTKKKAILDSM